MKTTYPNGTTKWQNSQDNYHRLNGPAIHYASGTKRWFINGKLHRINGPATHYNNGAKFWFINETKYSEADYNRILKLS